MRQSLLGYPPYNSSLSAVPKLQASLRAVFAAIFGIALATNWRNVRPIFVNNRKKGSLAFGVTFGIMIGSAMIYVLLNPPVIVLYLLGGLCGALVYRHVANKKEQEG